MNTPRDWRWWLQSDAGLLARIAIGACIFVVLATADLRRHGSSARRWREYLFLICAAAAGIAYGAGNDLITSWISWEYFYYGKGLDAVLATKTPPDLWALRRQAILVGMKAAGSAGLIIGAALLIANNPRPRRAQLPCHALWLPLCIVFAGCAFFAAVLGCIGYRGGLAWTSHDLQMLVHDDLFRPRRFLCAYGIHLGAYVGVIVGTVWGIAWIRRARVFIEK